MTLRAWLVPDQPLLKVLADHLQEEADHHQVGEVDHLQVAEADLLVVVVADPQPADLKAKKALLEADLVHPEVKQVNQFLKSSFIQRINPGSRPASRASFTGSRPGSAKSLAWAEENVVEEEEENTEEMEEEEDEGPLIIKGEDDIPKVGFRYVFLGPITF